MVSSSELRYHPYTPSKVVVTEMRNIYVLMQRPYIWLHTKTFSKIFSFWSAYCISFRRCSSRRLSKSHTAVDGHAAVVVSGVPFEELGRLAGLHGTPSCWPCFSGGRFSCTFSLISSTRWASKERVVLSPTGCFFEEIGVWHPSPSSELFSPSELSGSSVRAFFRSKLANTFRSA